MSTPKLRLEGTLDTILAYFKKTIELEPSYASGAAHRILGIIYYRIPGVMGGNSEVAMSHFDQALAIGPNEPMNYLEFVKFLSRKKGDSVQALRLARRGAALPRPPADMVESADAWAELKEMLSTLESEYGRAQPSAGLHATHDIDHP